jgi:ribosomal protein L16 Arg81 hydroxylase
MLQQTITFRDILHPVTAEDFFDETYGRRHLYVPGTPEKFARVFSWEAMSELLSTTALWTDRSMKTVLDGRQLTPQEFCRPALTREGQETLQPDPRRVSELLRKGATVVLDFIESLTPELASVAATLEIVAGGPVACNAYCSWQAHPGFAAHFDTMDVFALHISGTKTWHLYEGRAEGAAEIPGFNCASVPPEQRELAKGRVLQEVTMKPGDFLYVPRGQYHDALATSEASLHVSFGVTEPIGQDFMAILLPTLARDPLFRASLPHFDEPEAHQAHLRKLAERMQAIAADPKTSGEMRAIQRQRASRHCVTRFALPARKESSVFRVRSLHAKLARRGGDFALKTRSGEGTLSAAEGKAAQWAMARDYFDADGFAQETTNGDAAAAAQILTKLSAAGLIERL